MYMIYEYFRATGAYVAVQGLPDLFTISLQDDDGSSIIISERSGPGRNVQVKITEFCSNSDCVGFVSSKKLAVEDSCKTSY